MPYNNAIPQANDIIRDSQPQILENFRVIKQAFDINHVAMNDGDEGKHKHVSFPEQAANPVTAVDEMAMFSKLSALTGQTALFLRQENNGSVYEFTSAVLAQSGWTRLPSGVILKWGLFPNAGAGLITYTFPVAADTPAFINIFTVLLSTYYANIADGDAFCRLQAFTTLNMTVYSSARSTVAASATPGFTYLAIGSD